MFEHKYLLIATQQMVANSTFKCCFNKITEQGRGYLLTDLNEGKLGWASPFPRLRSPLQSG